MRRISSQYRRQVWLWLAGAILRLLLLASKMMANVCFPGSLMVAGIWTSVPITQKGGGGWREHRQDAVSVFFSGLVARHKGGKFQRGQTFLVTLLHDVIERSRMVFNIYLQSL